jgi:glucose-6-phosphate 1-epimerase
VASEAIGRGFESLRARQNLLMTFTTHTLQSTFGQLRVSEYGGQLLSWQTADGVEQLYTPDNLHIQQDCALRGGVPICFPQFSGRGSLPKHGLVRTRPWQLVARHSNQLIFHIGHDAESLALWPYEFALQQTITLDTHGLHIQLQIHNKSIHSMRFTTALHTYFRVDDVTTAALQGLHACAYEDAADGGIYKNQQGDLHVAGEVDRVFANAPTTLVLQRANQSDLRITQHGFSDTVVWCPGPTLARALTDMPDTDWRHMLCIEAAAVAQAITLEAGATWLGAQNMQRE